VFFFLKSYGSLWRVWQQANKSILFYFLINNHMKYKEQSKHQKGKRKKKKKRNWQ